MSERPRVPLRPLMLLMLGGALLGAAMSCLRWNTWVVGSVCALYVALSVVGLMAVWPGRDRRGGNRGKLSR